MSAGAERTSKVLAPSPVEVASGIDSMYLSGHGVAPDRLIDDLEHHRIFALESEQPVSHHLGGYPVKVLPRAYGKYRYAVSHELALVGITTSARLPVARIQPTAIALHALGPATTALWAHNLLDAMGIQGLRLTVNRLDLHADWQGIEIRAN